MSEEQTKMEGMSAPPLAQAVYQLLPWICVPILVLSLCFGLLYGYQSYIDRYRYLFWMHCLLQVVFLISCIGAMTRRGWASQWLRVSGVWCLALVWSDIPSLAERTVWNLLYREPIYLGGASDLMKPHFPSYIYLLGRSLFFLALLALTISSHIVYKNRQRASTTPIRSVGAGAIEYGCLLYAGVLGIFFGLIIYWLDSIVAIQIYLDVVGTYLLVAGVACVLIWHLSAQGLFLAGLPICISSILFIYKQYGFVTLTLVLWVPLIVLGVIYLCQKNYSFKLRTIAVCLPVVLTLISLSSSFVPIIGSLRFLPYPEITSERPPDFPEYLQVPDAATEVKYRGGENPYLFFVINDPYPASKTLDFICGRLEQAGWKELDYDLMNPESESSHVIGWFDPISLWLASEDDTNDIDNNLRPSRWSAWWINEKDETISVHLSYEPPTDANDVLTTLCCNLSQHSAKSSMRGFLNNYKRIHQNKP